MLLLARGQAAPPGVVADRVMVGSEDVIRKVRTHTALRSGPCRTDKGNPPLIACGAPVQASGVLSASGVGAVAELFRPPVSQPTLEEARGHASLPASTQRHRLC